MLIWKKQIKYAWFKPDARAELIKGMLLGGCGYKILQFVSVLVNVAVPLLIYLFFGLDLILMGICFIFLDIVLNVFEQLFFITIPYQQSKGKKPRQVRRRIAAMYKEKERIAIKIKKWQKKHYPSCSYENCMGLHADCIRRLAALLSQKEFLEQRISEDESLLGIGNERKEETVSSDSERENTDCKDKKTNRGVGFYQQFFKQAAMDANNYIEKNHFDFLIPVRKACDSLSRILEGKTDAGNLIPEEICLKIDEFYVRVFQLVMSEDANKQKEIDEITMFARALSEEIQGLIIQVNRGYMPAGQNKGE